MISIQLKHHLAEWLIVLRDLQEHLWVRWIGVFGSCSEHRGHFAENHSLLLELDHVFGGNVWSKEDFLDEHLCNFLI